MRPLSMRHRATSSSQSRTQALNHYETFKTRHTFYRKRLPIYLNTNNQIPNKSDCTARIFPQPNCIQNHPLEDNNINSRPKISKRKTLTTKICKQKINHITASSAYFLSPFEHVSSQATFPNAVHPQKLQSCLQRPK